MTGEQSRNIRRGGNTPRKQVLAHFFRCIGYNVQRELCVNLVVKKVCKLAKCKTVSVRNSLYSYKRTISLLQHCAFYLPSGRIHPVYNVYREVKVMFFKHFKQIEDSSRKCIVTGTYILQFNYKCVQIFKFCSTGRKRVLIGSVQRYKFAALKAKFTVYLSIVKRYLILQLPEKTMFRCKNSFQPSSFV